MAISVKCPECLVRLKVADERAGEKVECPRCGADFTAPEDAEPAPAAPKRKPAVAADDDDRPAPTKSRKSEPASASRRRRDEDDDDDDDDDEERPRRRRPTRRKENNYALVFVLLGVAAFVVIGAVAGIWAFNRKKSDTASATTTPTPMPGPGAPALPGPGVPGAAGGAGPRTDRFSNNRGKIEGTKWSSVRGWVKGLDVPAGTLKLDFAADGRLRYDTPGGVFTGTYSLDSGDTVTFHLDRPLAGARQHAQRVVVNGNRLTVSDSDGTTLDFDRVW